MRAGRVGRPVDRAACVTWARMVHAIAQMDEKNRDHLPELIALPQVPADRARLALRALAYVRAGGLSADSAFDRALGSCEGVEL